MRYTDSSVPEGFVSASCDWKDRHSLFEGLLDIAIKQGVPFDATRFMHVYENSHFGPGDNGVTTAFTVADHILQASGFDIVQCETGGDYYVFYLAPLDFHVPPDIQAMQDACAHEDDPEYLEADRRVPYLLDEKQEDCSNEDDPEWYR